MANLDSLMLGGYEVDDDIGLATEYELMMEQWEHEHPAPPARKEEKMTFNSKDYVSPFFVQTSINGEEYEDSVKELFDAIQMGEGCEEDGGHAKVVDSNGNEVPLFEIWDVQEDDSPSIWDDPERLEAAYAAWESTWIDGIQG